MKQTGWVLDNGKWYHISESGIMETGWQEISGARYFFYESGAMAFGESLISGKAYTFTPDGVYQHDGIHRAGLDDDVITAAWESYYNNYDVIVHAWKELNQDRAAQGRSQLELYKDMCIAAAYRAHHMYKYNYAGHIRNNVDLANEAYKGYTNVFVDISENIDKIVWEKQKERDAYQLCSEAENDLLTSDWHAFNILRPEYNRVGIGFILSEDGTYFNLVQLFTDRTDF